jgi:hypothetical protein
LPRGAMRAVNTRSASCSRPWPTGSPTARDRSSNWSRSTSWAIWPTRLDLNTSRQPSSASPAPTRYGLRRCTAASQDDGWWPIAAATPLPVGLQTAAEPVVHVRRRETLAGPACRRAPLPLPCCEGQTARQSLR